MTTAALPPLHRIRQAPRGPRLERPAEAVATQLETLDLRNKVRPGQRVALTVGSRGIAALGPILRAAAEHLKSLGAQPFFVPAMGSHGGGTAEGQRAVLAGYGLTEESLGAEIRASMETVELGRTASGVTIVVDRHAFEAEHILACNRIKAHTIFSGRFQSGLCKMLLVGLGKHTGARNCHAALRHQSFDDLVGQALPLLLASGRILGGLALVENGRDEAALLEAVAPDRLLEREPELLRLALDWMPRLPLDEADLLIVDEMGKNFSGTGMDTNVIGRKTYHEEAAPGERPRIARIHVRSLTPQSQGNATGIGLADFCATRLVQTIDWTATYTNALASGLPARAKLPIHFPTDREAILAALRSAGVENPSQARLVRIRNTLALEELLVSPACLDQIASRPQTLVLPGREPMAFDAQGNLA